MPATDRRNKTNFDYHRLADCELSGEMSASEITEALQLLYFSGNPTARKTVRIDAEVRRYLVDVLKAAHA